MTYLYNLGKRHQTAPLSTAGGVLPTNDIFSCSVTSSRAYVRACVHARRTETTSNRTEIGCFIYFCKKTLKTNAEKCGTCSVLANPGPDTISECACVSDVTSVLLLCSKTYLLRDVFVNKLSPPELEYGMRAFFAHSVYSRAHTFVFVVIIMYIML